MSDTLRPTEPQLLNPRFPGVEHPSEPKTSLKSRERLHS